MTPQLRETKRSTSAEIIYRYGAEPERGGFLHVLFFSCFSIPSCFALISLPRLSCFPENAAEARACKTCPGTTTFRHGSVVVSLQFVHICDHAPCGVLLAASVKRRAANKSKLVSNLETNVKKNKGPLGRRYPWTGGPSEASAQR